MCMRDSALGSIGRLTCTVCSRELKKSVSSYSSLSVEFHIGSGSDSVRFTWPQPVRERRELPRPPTALTAVEHCAPAPRQVEHRAPDG